MPPGAGHAMLRAILTTVSGETMKRFIALLLLAAISIATLSGCNTMEGLGKDVQKLGQKVEDKAAD
jgi:entericidin A